MPILFQKYIVEIKIQYSFSLERKRYFRSFLPQKEINCRIKGLITDRTGPKTLRAYANAGSL
jgi:hypothetical protein